MELPYLPLGLFGYNNHTIYVLFPVFPLALFCHYRGKNMFFCIVIVLFILNSVHAVHIVTIDNSETSSLWLS